ncbi:MAG: hypothetical protein KGJ86_00510 [Chloroflexota bacterium]|nr:hypothetical protein [Chloroflexota bacterium]
MNVAALAAALTEPTPIERVLTGAPKAVALAAALRGPAGPAALAAQAGTAGRIAGLLNQPPSPLLRTLTEAPTAPVTQGYRDIMHTCTPGACGTGHGCRHCGCR